MVYGSARGMARLRCAVIGVILIATLTLDSSSSSAAVAGRCQLWFQSKEQTACWRPFTAASPFNRRLPARPKPARDNAAVGRHMRAYRWVLQATPTTSQHGFSLSVAGGTRPVYFGTPSDPVMTISCSGWYGPSSCQGGNGITTNGVRIHVPAGATPGSNWDAHLTIVETATGNEYDLWHASASGSVITAATGAVENVNTSNGIDDGGDAASLALTGGLLRPSELASGHIDHALVISVPCTNAGGANVGFSWPASGGWGQPCGEYQAEAARDAPPIGALFKLKMTNRQIAASNAPAWERTIMTALSRYGAYAEDTNGSANAGLDILMQDQASWTSIGKRDQWATTIAKFGGRHGMLSSPVPISTSRLELVAPCVARGSCGRARRHAPAHRPRRGP